MKKFILFIGLLSFITLGTYAKSLQAVFSYASFSTPDNKPYIETNLSVRGSSVSYVKKRNGKFEGSIQITTVYKKDGKIVHADKYNLLTPEVADTSNITFNFMDQKRAALSNGDYILEMDITDNNMPGNKSSLRQPVHIEYTDTKIISSDIALIESYTASTKSTNPYARNGFDMVPMVDNFYPGTIEKLIFYAEIYNTAKLNPGESYLLSYFLENAQSNEKLGGYNQSKKIQSQDVIVAFGEFNITQLASGNYNVVVELKNRNNEVVTAQRSFIQRSNKALNFKMEDVDNIDVNNTFASKYNYEQMRENILSLNAISNSQEKNYTKTVLANKDLTRMQQYLVYFWQKREGANAENAWEKYLLEVRKVNAAYSSQFTKGYDTDRGIVYLKYGPPNAIKNGEIESMTFPYEIWRYETAGTQRNRRFVFYSPDNIPNELVLLHSNVNGEKNEPQWKQKLLLRSYINNPKNDKELNDMNYGGQLDQDFND